MEKTCASLPSKEVSPRGVPFKETLRWCSSSRSASEAPWKTTWIWAGWEDEASSPSTEKGTVLLIPPTMKSQSQMSGASRSPGW